MADGSVLIEVKADISEAENRLAKLKGDIKKLEDGLKEKTNEQSAIKDKLEAAQNAAYEAEKEIARLSESVEDLGYMPKGIGAEIEAQTKILSKQDAIAEKLGGKYEAITDEVSETTIALEKAKEEAGELQETIDYANSPRGKLKKGWDGVSKSIGELNTRILGMAKRVFVFSIITAGLRAMRDALGDAVNSNTEAAQATANLKAALSQLAAPLLNVVIPAFTFLVNVLTALVQLIAAFFSILSGGSDNTSALYDKADAIGAVGSAAKSSSKQLASFDEINKLSGNSGGGASGIGANTDLSTVTELEGKFKTIAMLVLTIGAGVAGWKLGKILNLANEEAAGLAVALSGLALLVLALVDMFENGINWNNLAEVLTGAILLVGGLDIAFGRTGGTLGLIVTAMTLVVAAFHEFKETGEITKEMVAAIEAALIALGAAFSLITKNKIPGIVGAVLGLITVLSTFGSGAEEIMQGFKSIMEGVLLFMNGDFKGGWAEIWDGIKSVFTGVWKSFATVAAQTLNKIIDGINSAISKINKIGFEVPDWIPGIGGKSWHIDIPSIKKIDVPYLAQGAVIPPNREFMAVLGDQQNGRNLEAPEDLIRQIIREELRAANGSDGRQEAILYIGEEQAGRIVYRLYNTEKRRASVSLVEGKA